MPPASAAALSNRLGLLGIVARLFTLTVLAALSYFTPVFSTLLASLWLGVRPGPTFWQGVAMVVAGSLLCWFTRRGQA